MQPFVIPNSHNRGRDPWIEYAIPPASACPPPVAADTPAPARPASDAVWFAPGADDLSRLPERDDLFDHAWYCITSGEWPRGRRKRHKGGAGDPFYREQAFALHRDQDAIIREIYNDGFVWLGGDVDGHFIPPFTEIGNRTTIAAAYVIRRVVAQTERRPLSGQTKGVVVKEIRKSAALFNDYIVLNRRVRGIIRVDHDGMFKSWNDVHNWLVYLYKEGVIPCLPHAAVARRTADGRVEQPHFLILLPLGDEVRWDKRFKSGARGLFKAVENGWIRGLQGDPGGAKNGLKIKNPACPKMTVAIFNQSRFLTLREMSESLDCSRFNDRHAAATESELDFEVSNLIFTHARQIAWPTVARMCDLGDPRYPVWLDDRKRFRNGLFEILAPAAIARWSGDKTPNAIRTVVWHVCKRVARDWDPGRALAPDRGAMGLPQTMPLLAKQKLSGRWASAKRRSETIDQMAAEVARIELAGRPARPGDLIDTGKWKKSSVYNNFEYAVLLNYFNSIPVVGKKDNTPIAPNCGETDQAEESAIETLRAKPGELMVIVGLPLPEVGMTKCLNLASCVHVDEYDRHDHEGRETKSWTARQQRLERRNVHRD